MLLALDNLETLELDELQQLERFLSGLRWPSKPIVTTRERRMTVNCHIHVQRLEKADAVALLEREMARRGIDVQNADRSSRLGYRRARPGE